MLERLLVVLACSTLAPVALPRAAVGIQDQEAEFETRRKEAAGDLAKLWKLADWCEARGLVRQRDLVLRDILELDDTDKKAHELLGHLFHDGRWFDSQRELDAYERKQEREAEREARAKGLVRFGDAWVEPADVPFLEAGLVRDEAGNWITKEEAERLAAGWRRQDLEWVAPEEVPMLEQGLWKCGEEWLSLEEADRYHGEPGHEWRIPGEHFLLYTTLPRDVAMKALTQIDYAQRDLERLFGVHPARKPVVLVLSSLEQYDAFSKGDREKGDIGRSAFGLSSIHGAYLADNWFDEEGHLLGAGVTYWDANDATASAFAPLWARHAAGQAFVEAVDPSPEAAAEHEEKGTQGLEFAGAFWKEKRLPPWLRYGASVYVERYAPDPFVKPGGDRLWARKWSIQNILQQGGLDSVEKILAFQVGPDDVEASSKLVNESGLVLAFALDGGCGPVEKELARFREALKASTEDRDKGESALEKALERLEKALVKNEKKLAAFAGI